MQWSSPAGSRNFAISSPETWNSLQADLCLSTLSTANFARRLKVHLFITTEKHVPAVSLILLKTMLFINIIIIIIISKFTHLLRHATHHSSALHLAELLAYTSVSADVDRWQTRQLTDQNSAERQDSWPGLSFPSACCHRPHCSRNANSTIYKMQ